jgi:carboxypeptidase T
MKNLSFLFILLFPGLVSGQILSYTAFRTPAQAQTAINTLHSTYPSLTQLSTIGYSVEGRAIRALKISSTPTVNDPAKGDVVFCALHHAREWMTVETIIYIADRLLAEYSTNPSLQADINRLQIWIIPVVNPDGYQYSASTNRMWRKNRRPNWDGSFGVDLNRNWGYQWGNTALGASGSATPTDDVYFGTGPFSEPETNAMRNFLNARTNLKCFVTYHSYSELYLRPWAHTTADPPGESTLRSDALRQIGKIASVHGHTYAETIWYNSIGEATDWVWNEKRVAAFTPELRPSSSAGGGFAPPASEILPCAQENYPAACALIHDAGRTEIFVRDNAADTGIEPSSGAFWTSPDIWSAPSTLTLGSTATLNIRVNNNTGVTQNNVTVEAYYTDPRITLEFPSLSSVPIGTQVVSVPAGGTVLSMTWNTPSVPNIWGEPHWCVGVVVKHENDMPLTTVVNRSSNVACKNFDFVVIEASGLAYVAATNFLSVAAELQVDILKEGLPPEWQIELPDFASLQKELKSTTATFRKAKLLKTSGLLLEPGETVKIPIKIKGVKEGSENTLNISGKLVPLVGGERRPIENGYSFGIKSK